MNKNIAQLQSARSKEAYSLTVRQQAVEFLRTLAARGHRKNPRLTRFVIFGQGRSGSTLLESLLDSHPEVTCEDELLRFRFLMPFARIERHARAVPAGHKAFGFHLKPWHVTRIYGQELPPFISALDEKGYKFIHHQRANWFLQSLSQVKFVSHKVAHAREESQVPQGALSVDPEMLVFLLREKEALAKEEAAVIQQLSQPAIRVVYEHDLQTPEQQQRAASRLFQWLGLPDAQAKTSMRKVSPEDWRLGVQNVEEVEAAVQEAGFGRFLTSEFETSSSS